MLSKEYSLPVVLREWKASPSTRKHGNVPVQGLTGARHLHSKGNCSGAGVFSKRSLSGKLRRVHINAFSSKTNFLQESCAVWPYCPALRGPPRIKWGMSERNSWHILKINFCEYHFFQPSFDFSFVFFFLNCCSSTVVSISLPTSPQPSHTHLPPLICLLWAGTLRRPSCKG